MEERQHPCAPQGCPCGICRGHQVLPQACGPARIWKRLSKRKGGSWMLPPLDSLP